ncbi:baseplate J/gp47 family protein [Crassaminicella thermophila]|uniref:Baseplate J/gp47 family protein n=1 Tax=Crassaminicella thermophila TaxID=2599308 RepID=A0A5C0SDS7_CRATE|nr:baseplate J/gp47 family protein [Crassaminicella thermophila]QEK12703.1 baseplate J/gp47 family protein [Crassaminicella thermophila]
MIQKDMQEILQEMLQDFAQELGVSQISSASDIAIKSKVLASQIEGLFYNQGYILKQAFPQTATGEYLELHGYIYGVDRKQATKATGIVRMGRNTAAIEDILIPAGTSFSTLERNGVIIRGVTTEEAILTVGNTYVDIVAEAEEPGTNGNVEAGTFTILTEPPAGIEYVINLEPFTGGTDLEDEEEYRKRLLEKVRSPQLGGNKKDYENWALAVEGVTIAKALPLNRGAGTVDILISTSSGLPSDVLVSEVQSYIDERRPVGADAKVIKPTVVNVNVDVTITPSVTNTIDDIRMIVEDTIKNYIESIEIGGVVKIAGIINALFKLNEVDDVDITSPTTNIVLAETEVAQAGVINVV